MGDRHYSDSTRGPGRPVGFILTTNDFAVLPASVTSLVDTVVEAPPLLRRRTEDIMPLAHHFARMERHREVVLSPVQPAGHAETGRDNPLPDRAGGDRRPGRGEARMGRATVYRKIAEYNIRLPGKPR